MEPQVFTVHPMHMVRGPKKPAYRRTFLHEWRDSADMTLEVAAAEMGLSHSQLSRIERGHSPYSQRILEAAAKLYGCTPSDLLTRGPDGAQELFDIWSHLDTPQRQQAARVLRALKEDGK